MGEEPLSEPRSLSKYRCACLILACKVVGKEKTEIQETIEGCTHIHIHKETEKEVPLMTPLVLVLGLKSKSHRLLYTFILKRFD